MRVKQTLRECPVFAGLSDADLERIAGIGVTRDYEAGSTLFAENEAADELFVVLEGKVALQMSVPVNGGPGVKKATVDIARSNDIAGWSALIEPYQQRLTAVCLQKTRALVINGAGLRAFLQGNQLAGYETVRGLARIMSARLDDACRLLVSERSWQP
ncbi:MAG: cyclic nucleotide-binding domain-containing protein [Chloroflexi bacterium]|nr:cyclic nucleotide-binding domain-containing protein [Chloroflexota bacterium]